MSLKPVVRCAGLYTNPSDIGEVPEGALVQADNVVVSRDGICEPRRGLPFVSGAPALRRLIPYQAIGKLIGLGLGTDFIFPDATVNSNIGVALGRPVDPTNANNRWAEMNGRIYVTGVGPRVYRIDGTPSSLLDAGVARGLDNQLSLVAGSMLAAGSTVGYRVLWGLKPANGTDIMFGAPSGLTMITNGGGGAQSVQLLISVPPMGVETGEQMVLQIYRTASSVSFPVVDEPCLVYQEIGSFGGTVTFTDNVPDALLGAALYTNPSQGGIASANFQPPGALDLAQFRGSMFYANAWQRPRLTVHLLAVGTGGLQIGDTITLSSSAGGTITITGAAAQNIGAKQFLVASGGTPQANVAATANSIIQVLNVALWTPSTQVVSYLLSGPNDPAGIIGFEVVSMGTGVTFACSRNTAFLERAGATTSWASQQQPNALWYSQTGQPEAVPLLNVFTVGGASAPILRIVPLRDSLIILKGDGIWRVTGDGPFNFRVDPLDLTVNCLCAESAVALENTVVALTQQGVVRVSDTGVTVISRPIENLILPLLGPAMLAATQLVGYGIAYESGRKYILFLPATSLDTYAKQAYAYDLFTDTWTHWTMPTRHGLVSPVDDRLYVCDGALGTLRQERKSFDQTDYADETYAVTISAHLGTSVTLADATNALVGDRLIQGVGTPLPGAGAVVTAKIGNVLTLDRALSWSNAAATIYRAIPVVVQWECQTPRETGPGTLAHWREADFLFRSLYFAQASAFFETEIDTAGNTESLNGSLYGLTDPPIDAVLMRVLVPRPDQRAARLHVTWSMSQAMCQMQLQGMQTAYEPGRERTRR